MKKCIWVVVITCGGLLLVGVLGVWAVKRVYEASPMAFVHPDAKIEYINSVAILFRRSDGACLVPCSDRENSSEEILWLGRSKLLDDDSRLFIGAIGGVSRPGETSVFLMPPQGTDEDLHTRWFSTRKELRHVIWEEYEVSWEEVEFLQP